MRGERGWPMIRAIDTGVDHHAETQAFLAKFDAHRRASGKPRILHNHTKHIQGWLIDDDGHKWFELAPHHGTPAWQALVDCWWNRNAVGGR